MTSQKNDALERAISEAEAAMKALQLSQDPVEKKRLRAVAQRYMQDAERLKTRIDIGNNSSSTTNAAHLSEPRSTRRMEKSEQILLLKAGFLNGDKFPPWINEPAKSEFELSEGQSLFCDDTSFSLSAYQQKVFAGWHRPAIALAAVARVPDMVEPTMKHIGNIDLVQDASTDCSVVASLCAGVARALRGHARLLRPVLFPQEDGTPSLSNNGKYIVRLNFNGCYRRVIIDDRLPMSKTDRIIHVIDRLNSTLLWPALVEKAYLKIRGGYDFPGSNSATDLWIITGWLPEQVFLQPDDLDLAGFWTKISNAFTYGDVLITMGTGKMSKKLEKEVGLAGEHDYAVVDIKEVGGQRLMLVKNPWCEGTNWYRVPRRQSRADLTEDEEMAQQSPRDLLNADDQLSPGTFWMDIDNAAQYFESIYLNWNPGLFTHRQDLHFAWNLSTITGNSTQRLHASLINSPQFSISTKGGGTVWLLLCRHLRNPEPGTSEQHIDLTGFIALAAYATEGLRVNIAGRHIARSNFVDSPQILLKLPDCQPGSSYTVLPLEQELTAAYQSFTLSVFGNSAIDLGQAVAAYAHRTKAAGLWTKDTAGGNAHSPSYSTNPQFRLELIRPTRISLLLEATDAALNVHVKMVHGKGERIYSIQNRDILFDSSDYRRRCCTAESKATVDAGVYTIICSTFESQQLGAFELLVESDEAVVLKALPREGAGRLQMHTKVVFAHGSTRIAAKLIPRRLANLRIIARAATTTTVSSQLNITIEQGHGVQSRVLTSSEPRMGDQARIQDFNISPEMLRYGDLFIVLERTCVVDQADMQAVDLQLLVDQAHAVDFGEWS